MFCILLFCGIDSITFTSEGSAIEARISLLKKQLQQRQAEVKRVTNERNRRRKQRLRKQEEQLMKQLEVRVVYELLKGWGLVSK